VGFTNEEINDIHHRALPVSLMKSNSIQKISDNHYFAPHILDEGLVVFPTTSIFFEKKNSNKSWDVASNEKYEIKISSALLLELIDIAEENIIKFYHKKGLINLKEANKFKNDLKIEIKEEEANTFIKSKDVGDLTTVFDYVKINLNNRKND